MTETAVDETILRSLHAKGHSQAEIARLMSVPRSTIQARIKRLGLVSTPTHTSVMYTEGVQYVHTNEIDTMLDDLRELVAWWHERKAVLQVSQDTDRETRRVTFFVEKRWEDAIRRQSDLDGTTYTQIVNDAFRQYFEGKST